MPNDFSIVEYFGLGEGHRCGYCKGSTTSLSHGMWAHTLSCEDYEDLMNRGWRRSGKYVYKPLMDKTCCPQYTIRCDVANVKLTKSQKKVLRRMNNYLLTGDGGRKSQDQKEKTDNAENYNHEFQSIEPGTFNEVSPTLTHVKVHEASAYYKTTENKKNSKQETTDNLASVSAGMDSSRQLCRKAKEIRKEKRKKKLLAKSRNEHLPVQQNEAKHKNTNAEKSLEDYIEISVPSIDHAHNLEVTTVRSSPDTEEFENLFEKEYLLFQRYQVAIHHETIEETTRNQFRRFLVNSPLKPVPSSSSGGSIPSTGLGSFHQQYYLDGKLIAVGVLDILPHCVSSKYFFYDPDYHFLSLGTYSALREIYFVRQLQQSCPSMLYYYMGYYIHNCPKMRYKGNYNPSFLLCPEKYTFVPIETCLPKLNESKYARLEKENSIENNNDIRLGTALILHRRQAMPFDLYKHFINSSEVSRQKAEITEYVTLAGQRVADRMLLFRKTTSDSDSD